MFGNNGNPHADLERNSLRLLCSVLIQPVTRTELLGLLDASLFSDVVNRVAYEEICALGPVRSRTVRELLPTRMVNRGFADFDLHEFLGASEATESQIEQLFESILKLIELRHRSDTTPEN